MSSFSPAPPPFNAHQAPSEPPRPPPPSATARLLEIVAILIRPELFGGDSSRVADIFAEQVNPQGLITTRNIAPDFEFTVHYRNRIMAALYSLCQ